MEAAFGIVRQSVIRARPQGPLAAAALAVCAASLAPSAPAFAQLGPGGPQDLQRLLQSGSSLLQGGRARVGANDYLEQPDVLIDPAEARRRAGAGLAVEEPPISPLERDYSLRSGEFLRQFGYAAFRNRVLYRNRTTGAIRDSYRLGVGDEVIVTLHGQDWSNQSVPVDRSGRIIVPQLPPVAAAGRTLGEVRASLRASVKRSMLGTEVFVSMGRLRAVDVTVAGEVEFPGVYHLTGLSTLMDALIHAGGPNRKGSLRRVHLNRGEEVRSVDLYELFVRGGLRRDITLREGDRIVVPTIGPTVALAGHVTKVPPNLAQLFERVRPMLDTTQPPSLGDLAKSLGHPLPHLEKDLRALAGLGFLTRVSANRYYLKERLLELVAVARRLHGDGPFSVRQFRDASGVGRNVVIEVLEHLDRHGVTRREGDLRQVVGDAERAAR